MYAPRSLSLVSGCPSPIRHSGQFHFTCLTVLPGSDAMMSPRLASSADAVPLVMVKFRPVS